MKQTKLSSVESVQRRQRRPARTIEARENQMILLAMDLAEDRLRNGTATAQEVVHFLKLGSTKERLERENLERQNQYLTAKIEAIQSVKASEELSSEAIEAFKTYRSDDESGSSVL